MMFIRDNIQVFYNGCVGLSASALAVISTFQQQLDWYVRFAGGVIGLAIGMVSLYRLLTQSPKK